MLHIRDKLLKENKKQAPPLEGTCFLREKKLMFLKSKTYKSRLLAVFTLHFFMLPFLCTDNSQEPTLFCVLKRQNSKSKAYALFFCQAGKTFWSGGAGTHALIVDTVHYQEWFPAITANPLKRLFYFWKVKRRSLYWYPGSSRKKEIYQSNNAVPWLAPLLSC